MNEPNLTENKDDQEDVPIIKIPNVKFVKLDFEGRGQVYCHTSAFWDIVTSDKMSATIASQLEALLSPSKQ